MLCQRCHKNIATVRYAEVVDGKVADQHVCSECMAKQQDVAASGFELTGAAPTPRRSQSVQSPTDNVVTQKTCRACGVELKDVLQEARAGCSVCYESFGENLEPVLRGIHVAPRHRGKAPRLDDQREVLRAELQTKRALLRTSLKAENYEEAAQLRDTIREIEVALAMREAERPGVGRG
jgi:protein arginine kinase activator